MTGRLSLLLVTLLLCANASAQNTWSAQAYGVAGNQHSDNQYKVVGADLFLETPNLFYVGSLAYLDATFNTRTATVRDTLISGKDVRETTDFRYDSRRKRITFGNRFEYFFLSGMNVAATFNVARETGDATAEYKLTYSRSSGSGLNDTNYVYPAPLTTTYLIGGIEVSAFIKGSKLGGGFVHVNDLRDLRTIQPYLFYTTNQYRTLVLSLLAGGQFNSKFYPLGKVSLKWRTTPDFELTGSLLYSGTTFIYEVQDRYLNYYREDNQILAGLVALYDVSRGLKIFWSGKFLKNDRFTMGIFGGGVYMVF